MRMLCIALALFALGNSALAAEPPKPRGSIFTIDGIAFAYQDVIEEGKNGALDKMGPVVALDVVAALDDDNPTVVADCAKFKTTHKGALWCFATAVNLATFVASRDKEGDSKYEPAFGGYCALGLSRMNAKVPGADPRTMMRIPPFCRNRAKYWSETVGLVLVPRSLAPHRAWSAQRRGT